MSKKMLGSVGLYCITVSFAPAVSNTTTNNLTTIMTPHINTDGSLGPRTMANNLIEPAQKTV